MIVFENQFAIKFSIADREDFILLEDLIKFKMIEKAGNVLPIFELAFRSSDDDILPLVNEGNDLNVSYGKSINEMVDSKLLIISAQPIRSGQNKRVIHLVGVYSVSDYSIPEKLSLSDKLSGIESVINTAKKHFNVVSNVTKSNDSQVWIQGNITDKQFVNECWLHSDVDKSFIMCGITSDGNFILKDIKKDLDEDYKWKFTTDVKTEKDIAYDGDYLIKMNTGFINNWVGYKRDKLIYNLEEGSSSHITEEIEPVVSLVKDMARKASVEKKAAITGFQSDNVHKNYHRSYIRNLSSNVLMGSLKVTISFKNNFKNVSILDKVMFVEDDISSKTDRLNTSIILSGIYYVANVTRVIEDSSYNMICELCRESFNDTKGEFYTEPDPLPIEPELSDYEKLKAEMIERFPDRIS